MLLAGASRRTFRNRSLSGNAPIFDLPLDDLGAGVVNTVPYSAFGSKTATFTRATTKMTKLVSGLWAPVGTGVAASCYLGANTAAGAYGGYFAEGAGTQLVTPTASIRDMTDAAWAKGATINVAKTGTGIDGVVNSCTRLTFGAVEATNTILQALVAAASSRTYSAFIQIVGTLSGTVSITQDGGSTWTDVTSQLTAANHVRVSLTASVLNASFGIKGSGNGDVVFVDFNQFEAGTFATSPMAAAGAARNADVLTYTFAGNALAALGTSYAELFSEFTSMGANTAAISFGTTDVVLGVDGNGSASTRALVLDGVNFAIASGLTNLATGVRKRASSWGAGGIAVTGDGVAPTTSIFGGAMNSAGIGIGNATNGTKNWYGTARNVRIYSAALNIQAMTA